MVKYVLDTSVLARFLVHQEEREIALEVFSQAYAKKIVLVAPSLIWYEINNVFVIRGISEGHIENILELFHELVEQKVIRIFPSIPVLLSKARDIANLKVTGKRYISTYDATFHALALLEDCQLLTADRKHYEKTKDIVGAVKLLSRFA